MHHLYKSNKIDDREQQALGSVLPVTAAMVSMAVVSMYNYISGHILAHLAFANTARRPVQARHCILYIHYAYRIHYTHYTIQTAYTTHTTYTIDTLHKLHTLYTQTLLTLTVLWCRTLIM